MIYVSQIITLYTLYSAECQLYLNKTGRKKGNWFSLPQSKKQGGFVGGMFPNYMCMHIIIKCNKAYLLLLLNDPIYIVLPHAFFFMFPVLIS